MVPDNYTLTNAGGNWDPPYHPIIQALGWLIASALSLETILGNAMVLLAYRLEKSISKQLNNRFIISLAVSDLIIGIEGIPFFTAYVINGDRWPLGAIACETWLFLDYTLCLVSILTVLLITADRYLSVCHTASYLKWQSPMKVQMLIFGSWLLPALIFGIMIFGWPWIGEMDEEATSNGECYAPFLANPFVNMSMYLAYYWTTLIAMLILYKGIHKAAKKLEKRSRAREHRHIALLLTQRLGTQVGVGLMLHARKYHEEVMKTKKPEPNNKDSGYATNNTLSTTDSGDRRRSSFAILVKAVQSTQKLQFRGRGTTFAFRTNANDEDSSATVIKGTATRQLGVHVQTGVHLERLSEQNSGSQVGVEVANEEITESGVDATKPEAREQQIQFTAAAATNPLIDDIDEGNSSLMADDEIDYEDDFPMNMVRNRFDSGAVASLSTEMFHEESLSSVLRFNPSAMASPLLDPAQSDNTSFEFIANRKLITNGEVMKKRQYFSLISHQQRNGTVKPVSLTTGSLKERRWIRPEEMAAVTCEMTPLPELRSVSRRDSTTKMPNEQSKLEDGQEELLCPLIELSDPGPCSKEFIQMPLPLSSHQSQQSLTLSVPSDSKECQQRRSSASSSHTHKSGSRRPSTRKSSRGEQAKQSSEVRRSAEIPIGLMGRIRQRLFTWMQTTFGLNSCEESTNVATGAGQDGVEMLPNFMHNSRSFSSMSSISSSTQPGMFSKRTSILPLAGQQQQQIPIPTLTITRDSITQQNIQSPNPVIAIEPKNAAEGSPQLSPRNEVNRRSSGFLQALFAPISTFQRRRKKTKAERRAHKAFRTITFIVGLFAILWSPYYVVATVYGFCHGDCIPAFLYNISYYMCYLNSSLNPFAYALANRQFRSAFSRILRGNFRQSN